MKKSLSLLSVVFSLFFITAHAQTTTYGSNAAAGHYIKVNGISMYYEVYGAGEPLLLIHGNQTPIIGWAAQIDYFAKKYKVIAVDCRGRGKSEIGKDSLTYIGMAQDMAELIQGLQLDSVNVIGKSDGAIVALLMGIYYPAHLKKLVSFGANLWPGNTALYDETVHAQHAEREEAEAMLAKMDKTKNWYIVQQRNRLMEFQPHITAADLQKIKVPVLVMSCDRDVIREEHTFFIYKNIPLSNLSIFTGELHGVPKLNPELFNATVDRFLGRPFIDNRARFK